MGKSKQRNRNRPPSKPRKARGDAPPPTPASPNLTLPSSLTVAQIQELQNLLEQRRVLSEFRDAEPGTLYIKRRGDEANMEIGVSAVKYDNQLRAILGSLVENTEQDLEKLGIDLEELEPQGEGEGEGEGDGEEEDMAKLLADAAATLEKINQRQAAAATPPAPAATQGDDQDPEDPEDSDDPEDPQDPED